MRYLTRRQEKIWRDKMIELEKTLVRYSKTDGDLDGSFCMSAFKSGFYLAQRNRKIKAIKQGARN